MRDARGPGRCPRPAIPIRLPDPVLDSPEQECVPGAWLSHESPEASVMMQIPGVGPFAGAACRQAHRGYAVTYGVWVGVHPGDLQRAFRVWREPEYENLLLEGALANSVPPWACWQPPSPWQ
jgi:hypothetical protein